MADPREQNDRQALEDDTRTISDPEPDRIDTNQKADDLATIVQPDGKEIEAPHPSEHGRL